MESTKNYEPSAWMRGMVAARIRSAESALRAAGAMRTDAILLMLTEPPEDATSAEREDWERSCDRCGKLCELGDDFHTGSIVPDGYLGRLNITFGLCGACKVLETGA